MNEPLDQSLAILTTKNYVCSACWGDLVMHPAENGGWYVLCRRCGSETTGYVTRVYAERRRAESLSEKIEVVENLRDCGILPNPLAGKSPDDLLNELGF